MNLVFDTIPIYLKGYGRVELELSDSISVDTQLSLWHAELCDIHQIQCQYKWGETWDYYYCGILLPKLVLDDIYNVAPTERKDFKLALNYVLEYAAKKNIKEIVPNILALLEAEKYGEEYSRELFKRLIAHLLCERERNVSFRVSKKDKISETDLLLWRYPFEEDEEESEHIIEDKNSLGEYVIVMKRWATELSEEIKKRDEEVFAKLDKKLIFFLECRRKLYRKIVRRLKVWNITKNLLLFLLIGASLCGVSVVIYLVESSSLLAIVILGMYAVGTFIWASISICYDHLKASEEEMKKSLSSIYCILGQVDSYGQAQLSHLFSKKVTRIHWLSVVMYAVTTEGDLLPPFDLRPPCHRPPDVYHLVTKKLPAYKPSSDRICVERYIINRWDFLCETITRYEMCYKYSRIGEAFFEEYCSFKYSMV